MHVATSFVLWNFTDSLSSTNGSSPVIADLGLIRGLPTDIDFVGFKEAVRGFHPPKKVRQVIRDVLILLNKGDKVVSLIEPGKKFEEAKTQT